MPKKASLPPGRPNPKAIRKQRGKGYGDPFPGHRDLGKTWAGILSDAYQIDLPPLPSHVVCLLLVALKLNRAAKPFDYRADDYVDARNYLDFAEENDPQNPNGRAKQWQR